MKIFQIIKGAAILAFMGPLVAVGAAFGSFNSGRLGDGFALMATGLWVIFAIICGGIAGILKLFGVPFLIGLPTVYFAGCLLAAIYSD